MRNKSYIYSILFSMLAIVLATACGNHAGEKKLKGSKADSLIFAAGYEMQFDRMIELADSFAQTGELSEVTANRWRGSAYYYKGEMKSAEHYYKKAVKAPIKDDQDLLSYNKSARRLATILVQKADYEGALEVAVPAVEKLEENGSGTDTDYAILLSDIGYCQLNMGLTDEAAESYARAYDHYGKRMDNDNSKRVIEEEMLGLGSIAKAYLSSHLYDEAEVWIERTENLLHKYELRADTLGSYADEYEGRVNLYMAIMLQGKGHSDEAALRYSAFANTKFGKSAEGRIMANDYLLPARRYNDAADNYAMADEYLIEMNKDLTLDNIQSLLMPKFRANVAALRKDSALAVGVRLCNALDSAIAHANHNAALELATIYETGQKETQIARQQAVLQRQRFIGGFVALLFLFVFFTVYTLIRRKSQKRLALAHEKLQIAYNQLEETTAVKERIESELRIARDIQMSMVPNLFPTRDGLDIYASMTPAKEVGGDMYGYLLQADLLYFCVGDVSGKGVPASLFMAQATRLFRTLATQQMMPAEIATRMNAALAENNEQGMFITMFIGMIDLSKEILYFANAGHNPPVIIDGDQVHFMEIEPNAPIGLWNEIDYVGEVYQNVNGKTLFLYTDGLNEAENLNKEQLGEERMLQLLKSCSKMTAKQTVEKLDDDVEKHRNGADPNDDLTMLCLRVTKP